MVTWVTWVTWVMVYDCFTHITNYSLYLPFHSSSIEFHSSILVTSAFLGLNGKTLPNWNWPWTPTSKKMQEVYPTGAPIRTTDIDLAQMGIERLLLFESGKFSVKTSASIVLYWLEWSKSLLFPKKSRWVALRTHRFFGQTGLWLVISMAISIPKLTTRRILPDRASSAVSGASSRASVSEGASGVSPAGFGSEEMGGVCRFPHFCGFLLLAVSSSATWVLFLVGGFNPSEKCQWEGWHPIYYGK